jgi:hypothetical protein
VPNNTRNALLAIALCLIAFFIIKVTFDSGVGKELDALGKVASSAVSSTATYTIEISGSGGTSFNGSYLVLQPSGSSASKSVEGIIPETYTAEGMSVSCAFQKQSPGTLRVTVKRNGQVMKVEQTTAEYGMVTIAN